LSSISIVMEKYILILLTILVVLVIVVVGFGYRKIEHLRTSVNRNTANINALQSYVSKLSIPPPVVPTHFRQPPANVVSRDEIDVSESESDDDFGSDTEFVNYNLKNVNDDFEDGDLEEGDRVEDISDEELDEARDVINNSSSHNSSSSDSEIDVNISELNGGSTEVNEEQENDFVVDDSQELNDEQSDEKSEIMSVIDENVTDTEVKNISLGETTKKIKTGTPNTPAKNFDVGYEMESDRDGHTYTVIETKTGQKRWKKLQA
jgi:hypothetical protein